MSSLEGKQFGNYRVLAKIGSGGMGDVYRAEDVRLGRSVALKMLLDECCDDSDNVRRFMQEARTASALNHPHILTIYEFDKYEGSHVMITEFVEGEVLDEVLSRGRLACPEALEIAIQVAGALKAAHDAGIVHRDIKPGNIMLRRDGIVKVLDFGIAKLATTPEPVRIGSEDETIARFNTVPGLVVGTPHYMSPEQARGKPVDHRSDIFSLGIVLYQMLTGKRPFGGETVSDVIASLLTHDPAPCNELVEDLHPGLEAVVGKMLRKDAGERHQDAEELVRELNNIKHQQVAGELIRTAGWDLSELGASAAAAGRETGPAVSRIAVIPFVNMGGDLEDDYFSEGLTEEILLSLSKMKTLSVLSRSATKDFDTNPKSHRQMAEELGVQFLLEGSVRRQGDHLRVTAQLVDTENQAYLWSEAYRGSLNDIFEIQERVAREIASALEVELSPREEEGLKKRYTDSTEAYQLYLKGRFFWNKRSEAGFKSAINYFQEAISLDEDYAIAWAGIADSYSLLSEYGKTQRKDYYPAARAAVEKALEIDDGLAEAHVSFANLLMLTEWDWSGARREFDRALELNPGYATAHHWNAFWHLYRGNLDDALESIKRAADLDPVSQAITKDVGIVLYYRADYEGSIKMANRTLEMDPAYAAGHRLRSLCFHMQGQIDKALEENSKWAELTGNRIEEKFSRAFLLAEAGRRDEAAEMISGMEEEAEARGNLFRGLALVYTALGDLESAFGALEKSCDLKEEALLSLKVDPKFGRLRSDERYGRILERMGI